MHIFTTPRSSQNIADYLTQICEEYMGECKKLQNHTYIYKPEE